MSAVGLYPAKKKADNRYQNSILFNTEIKSLPVMIKRTNLNFTLFFILLSTFNTEHGLVKDC